MQARHGERAKRVLSAALACALSLSLVGSLSGCKESDVLTQKIIGEVGQYEIDYSVPAVALDNPAAEQSTSSEYEGESDREMDLEEDTPEYDESPTTSEEIDEQVSSEYGNDSAASAGSEDGSGSSAVAKKGAGDGDGAASDDGKGKTVSVTTGEDPGEDEEDSSTSGSGAPDASDDIPQDSWTGNNPDDDGSSNPNAKPGTIVNGNYDNLPASGGVAAAGPYALIVQALCPGGLKACNKQWYDALPATAFDGKSEFGSTALVSAWGDGTAMNEATFEAIVESGADTVLTSLSYGGVTDDSWAQRFNEAGISVVELPVIGVEYAYDADIATCVQVIGELLKDSGYTVTVNGSVKNSKEMASLWTSQHDYAIEATVGANGGYAVTLSAGYRIPYIYQGASTVSNLITPVTRESTRFRTTVLTEASAFNEVADTWSLRHSGGAYFWPINDYASVGNLGSIKVDTSICYTRPHYPDSLISSEFYLSSYYLQCAGVADLSPTTTQTVATSFLRTTKLPTGSGGVESEANKIYPGSSDMPALVAKNLEIAQGIVASAAIADRSSKTIGLFNFGSPYLVYVMPSGVAGSWLDGTFESFLMAPWAYEAFTGTTDINLSETESMVSQFYRCFYRCSADGIINAEGSYWGGYLVATCPRD